MHPTYASKSNERVPIADRFRISEVTLSFHLTHHLGNFGAIPYSHTQFSGALCVMEIITSLIDS